VPEELTLSGQFKELLRQYCTSRIKAHHPEELLHGKPWTEDGLTMFQISGLMEFLNNRRFTYFTRAQVQEQLKRVNDNQDCHRHRSIKKDDGSRTTVRVWAIPSFETIEVDLPTEETIDEIPF